MGGHDSEIGPSTRLDRARERVLPASVDPPDQQAARTQNGGVDPLRARRRHRRASCKASRGRQRSSRPINAGTSGRTADRSIPVPADRRCRSGSARPVSRVCSARPFRPTTSRGSSTRSASASHTRTIRATELAGHGADVPHRRGARGRPDRGGRPPLRIRSAADRRSRRSRRRRRHRPPQSRATG